MTYVEQFERTFQQLQTAANVLPQSELRQRLVTKAKEFRPYIELAKKCPDGMKMVMEEISSLPYLQMQLIDMPIRANRIIRSVVFAIQHQTVCEGSLRTPFMNLIRGLDMLPMTAKDMETIRMDGYRICRSDFDVSLKALWILGLIKRVEGSRTGRIELNHESNILKILLPAIKEYVEFKRVKNA